MDVSDLDIQHIDEDEASEDLSVVEREVKIFFFQEISKHIHLHPNCEKIKFLGRSGVR